MIAAKRSMEVLLITVFLFAVMSAAAFLWNEEVYALSPSFDSSKLTFTSSDKDIERYLLFNSEGIVRGESSNKAVVKTVDYEGDLYFYIVPVGPGTAEITATDEYDNSTYKMTVTVQAGFFQNALDNAENMGPGLWAGFDEEDPYYKASTKALYGNTSILVRYPYVGGAKATLLINGKDTGASDETLYYVDDDNIRSFKCNLARKLGTKVQLRVEWNGAVRTFTAKIVSDSSITAKKIKAGSKRARAVLYEVHKGDYLKIKVGKKVVKTVKFKKDLWKKTVKWANKKKMKKGTKVTYILYNKYKQKLAKAARKVG